MVRISGWWINPKTCRYFGQLDIGGGCGQTFWEKFGTLLSQLRLKLQPREVTKEARVQAKKKKIIKTCFLSLQVSRIVCMGKISLGSVRVLKNY